MGWAYCGQDSEGRDIGYSIEAICDEPGCDEKIDRGLAYACGGMHGFAEYGCDRYFCYKHLFFHNGTKASQVCRECLELMETKNEQL